MRWRPSLLYSAVLVLIASAVAVLSALQYGRRWLAIVAVVGMAVAAVLFVLSVILPVRRFDWERIRAEQRLWESGPLGRAWLRVRQRLSDLWKM
jgi:hypothetical protein